ncbi:MAG: hypothetical protein JWL81_2859 [Verrucomicrobiales bacterium]|nr:hypothetical protein [Verrucomicrobiales bacterium]
MTPSIDPTTQQDVLATLDNLIEITRDGQEGFTQSAEHAKDGELKALFRKFATERAAMVTELQNLQRQHGATDIENDGTVTGTLHRAWINLRSVVTTHDDQAILEEAERGEDAAVAAHRDALQNSVPPLPRSVTSVLERHLASVQAAHDEVRDRRDSGTYENKA